MKCPECGEESNGQLIRCPCGYEFSDEKVIDNRSSSIETVGQDKTEISAKDMRIAGFIIIAIGIILKAVKTYLWIDIYFLDSICYIAGAALLLFSRFKKQRVESSLCHISAIGRKCELHKLQNSKEDIK